MPPQTNQTYRWVSYGLVTRPSPSPIAQLKRFASGPSSAALGGEAQSAEGKGENGEREGKREGGEAELAGGIREVIVGVVAWVGPD